MWHLGHLAILLSIIGLAQDGRRDAERAKVAIIDSATPIPPANVVAPPLTGSRVDVHFFAAVRYFNEGMYGYAHDEFNQVIRHPDVRDHEKRAEYLATSYYF